MAIIQQGKYSKYIKPLAYGIDLFIVNGLAYYFFNHKINQATIVLTISVVWSLLALGLKFYEVYRYSKAIYILTLLFKQFSAFAILLFAILGLAQNLNISSVLIVKYVASCFLAISIIKFATKYVLQHYRISLGRNYRNTVIIGSNKQTLDLEFFFNNIPEYGFNHKKTFNIESKTDLLSCFEFIIEASIDEIYCSISELSNKQLARIIEFADNNLKVVKFIPNNKGIYSKKLKYEYYGYTPILTLRNIPLDDSLNKFIKRLFDFVFSSLVIIFLLSWLTPILAILIKLESKGPVFFKQTRNGFNYKEFNCYKFRSMTPNNAAHIDQVTRGDQRVTKIGRFIRKTSIDELPQFFNVFFGDMSVVGPRPHMVSHTNMYAKRIDKFMVRHFVKPGITGLAQVSGFRGEVETESDIVNRVKYDIFYIENWSLLLDFKIIFLTIKNAIKGEDKAY